MMEAFIEFLKPFGFIINDVNYYDRCLFKISVAEDEIPNFVAEINQLMPIKKICMQPYNIIVISFKYTNIEIEFIYGDTYIKIFSDEFDYIKKFIIRTHNKTNLCDAHVGTLVLDLPFNTYSLIDTDYILSAKSIKNVVKPSFTPNRSGIVYDNYQIRIIKITKETLEFIIPDLFEKYVDATIPDGVILECSERIQNCNQIFDNVQYDNIKRKRIPNMDINILRETLRNPKFTTIHCQIDINNLMTDLTLYDEFIRELCTFTGEVLLHQWTSVHCRNPIIVSTITSYLNKLVSANNAIKLSSSYLPDLHVLENNTSLISCNFSGQHSLAYHIAVSDICRMNDCRANFKCAS